MTRNEPVVEVSNVTVGYTREAVLRDFSCSMYHRELTCIVGRSGCGKSTLLRAILGLLPVQHGSIRLLGTETVGISDEEAETLRRSAGVLFQYGALLRSMTVGENVAMPLVHHYGVPEEVAMPVVRRALRAVNLADTENLFPDELSGGMMKRAGLARALILEPPILFLDEPGAGLDPMNRKELDDLLLELRDTMEVTPVVITHEVTSIRRVGDRIIFIDDGHVLYEGAVDGAEYSENQMVRDFFTAGAAPR